jgi:hypothetical protein
VRAALAIAAVVILAAAGCGGSTERSSVTLKDLRSVDQLKSLFNEESGQPRLILLISPT